MPQMDDNLLRLSLFNYHYRRCYKIVCLFLILLLGFGCKFLQEFNIRNFLILILVKSVYEKNDILFANEDIFFIHSNSQLKI